MKSTQHKFLIKITLLFFFIKVLVVNAQYPNNSWSYNYDKFIVGKVSGGGGVSASVNNNVFTLNFNASWSPETFLKQGFIVSLDNYATTLPNTELPIPVGTFFSDKGYRFYLINNKIYIHGNSPLPLTSFSSSLTVNLLSPVSIPAETISFLSSNSGQNKIVTTEYLTNQGTSGNKNVFIMYYDGLGRELQQVNVGYTPQGKDLIQPFEYDSYGRKAKDYLPIPSSQNTGFLISPSSIATLASATYNGEPAFAEKIFDDSPLNRVAKQAAQGLDWQKNSGHEVKFVYDVNTL